MKRQIRRWWLSRRVTRIASQLDAIVEDRKTLRYHERLLVGEAGRLRGELLRLDIGGRRAERP